MNMMNKICDENEIKFKNINYNNVINDNKVNLNNSRNIVQNKYKKIKNNIILSSIDRNESIYYNPFDFVLNTNISELIKNVDNIFVEYCYLPIYHNFVEKILWDFDVSLWNEIKTNIQNIESEFINNQIINKIWINDPKYVISWAFFNTIDKIEFSFTINNITTNYEYIWDLFIWDNNKVLNNINLYDEINNFLKNRLYNIGSIKIFNIYNINIKQTEHITIQIKNIILIDKYIVVNYCYIVYEIDDIVYKYFYYYKNILNSVVIHKKYELLKKKITDYPIIKIKLNELKSKWILDSNNNFDGCYNLYFIWNTSKFAIYKSNIFKSHLLTNFMNKYSLKYYTNLGNELQICNSKNLIDNSITTPINCICYNDGWKNYACSCTYFRHPKYHFFQNGINLVLLWKTNYF